MKTMTFEKRVILHSFLPDIASGLIIFLYSVLSIRLASYITMPAFKYVLCIILVAQFMIAPVIDHFVYKDVSSKISDFESGMLDKRERTQLLEQVMHMPFICAVMTAIYFVLGSFTLFLIYYFYLKVALAINILSLVECFYGSYFAALYAYNYCNKICTEYASKIVATGLDTSYVMHKKYFGVRLQTQLFLYVIIPVAAAGIICCLVLYTGYSPMDTPAMWPRSFLQIKRMTGTIIMNICIQTALILLFYHRIHRNNAKMTEVLQNMQGKNVTKATFLETSIENEIAYNHYLSNLLISFFQGIISRTEKIGNNIKETSQNLIAVANETKTTALEQSTATNEIVSTMEDASRLSHEIEARIIEVASLADATAENVQTGSQILQENLNRMIEIEKSNETTITGIKDLTNKINGIKNIISIINSVADQTKIIAFNAELETARVLKSRKNFRNVASEIRRLANSTMESTNEIKNKINDIQKSADSLLIASQSNTEQIHHGSELAHQLEKAFFNIHTSADVNASTSTEIKEMITQQTASFEQIVKTLQQIGISVQNFSDSTKAIIDTADALTITAQQLGSISNTNEEDK
ncbi:MAG: hypothetical protein K6E51_04565 [Treponema sp.]|nr:hypothetical protein [Treponema sp.]